MSKKSDEGLPEPIRKEVLDYIIRSRPDLFTIKSFPVSQKAKERRRQEQTAAVKAFDEEDKRLQDDCDRQDIRPFISTDHRVGVNFTFNDGETVLIRAIKNGHMRFATQLIELGAGVNDTDLYEKTALHWAAEMGRSDLVRMLLEHGADRKLRDVYDTIPRISRSVQSKPPLHPKTAFRKRTPDSLSAIDPSIVSEATGIVTKEKFVAKKQSTVEKILGQSPSKSEHTRGI